VREVIRMLSCSVIREEGAISKMDKVLNAVTSCHAILDPYQRNKIKTQKLRICQLWWL